VREAPNLKRKVRGIHTIEGGSHPLLVWYVFRASVSDYSWWLIIDRLLYITRHNFSPTRSVTSGNHTPGSWFYSDLLDTSTSSYSSVFQSARLLV